jgi:hypothetical protein
MNSLMAETLAQTAARLASIRNSAISATTVDGISTTIDQSVADRRLREVQRAQAAEAGLPDPRPIVSRIKLN